MNYCQCELPIRMFKKPEEGYKKWHCATCFLEVNPLSKALNKKIDCLNISNATKNELELQAKVNEIIELLKANGSMQ